MLITCSHAHHKPIIYSVLYITITCSHAHHMFITCSSHAHHMPITCFPRYYYSLPSDLLRLRYSDDSIVVDVNSSSTYKTSIVLHVDFYTVDPTKLNITTSVSGPAGYFLEKSNIGSTFYDADSSTLVYAVTLAYHDHGGNQSVALSNITGVCFRVYLFICLFVCFILFTTFIY